MNPLSPSLLECTFIVLDAEKWQAQPAAAEESCMAGDVNLFLTDPGDPTLGEVEVMIAGVFCLALPAQLQRALHMGAQFPARAHRPPRHPLSGGSLLDLSFPNVWH